MVAEVPSDSPKSNSEAHGRLFRRILVPHDLTPSAATIFSRALSIARQGDAALFLAHVDDPARVNLFGYLPAGSYAPWARDCKLEALRQFRPLVAKAREVGVAVEVLALVGSCVSELIEAARQNDIDLIVLGHHLHRKPLERWLRGSSAMSLVKSAPCEILIVPLSDAH